MRLFPLKKCETNVTMLTEEQIQILAKKLADEHDHDEEQCKGHVRFAVNLSEIVHSFLPEDKKELFKEALEGGFFESLIQRFFSAGKEIDKIIWMIKMRMSYAELMLAFSKCQ